MASSPARVCIDMLACQTAGSRHRGIGNYAAGLALALGRLDDGAKTFLVAKRDPASVAEIAQSFAGVVPPHRLKTIDLPSPTSWQPGCAAMQAATLARAYARLNPDVLHISSLFEQEVAYPHPSLCAGRIKSLTLYDLIPYIFKGRYLSEPSALRWYLSKLGELKNYALLFASPNLRAATPSHSPGSPRNGSSRSWGRAARPLRRTGIRMTRSPPCMRAWDWPGRSCCSRAA